MLGTWEAFPDVFGNSNVFLVGREGGVWDSGGDASLLDIVLARSDDDGKAAVSVV